jgi:hypothetical protein
MHYADYRYAECFYAECRGVVRTHLYYPHRQTNQGTLMKGKATVDLLIRVDCFVKKEISFQYIKQLI